MIGPVDYSGATAPPAYRCADCGVAGVKLWRPWSTVAEHVVLRCAACALKRSAHADKDVRVDDDGFMPSRYGRTDQVGSMAPAVPTADGETYWGYTSVPDDGVAWWKRLPTRLPP